MKKLILALLILFSLRIQAQQNQNFWNKLPDDAKHVYAGVLITAASGSIVYQITDKPGWSVLLGFTCGVGAGLAKEFIWDKAMGKGTFNKWDAFETAWGAGIGSICLRVGIDVHERRRLSKEDKEKFENL